MPHSITIRAEKPGEEKTREVKVGHNSLRRTVEGRVLLKITALTGAGAVLLEINPSKTAKWVKGFLQAAKINASVQN